VKLLQDRLNDDERDRLDAMLDDVDANLEDIMREKKEYHK
jgi:hypothetical protein